MASKETGTETAKRHLLGVNSDELRDYCLARKQPEYRVRQILEWIYRKGAVQFDQMTNLSQDFRRTLAEDWMILSGSEACRQVAGDGTTKLLIAWSDEATSECVLIPDEKRRTACISSQVGCPVQCAFCASGLLGLQRQLTTGEIVEQAVLVRMLLTDTRLSNIVLMGLGEPLANYHAVIKAIRIINADWGMNIGARSITLSTVGLPARIRQLANEGLQINLAISLHAPNDELRRTLIPWARRVPIAVLVEALRDYFDRTHREVTIEYILLGGVNDRLEHADQLATLCRKMHCNVNLIRYNPIPGISFERPGSVAAHQFAERLRKRGVNVHIRKSRGLDINAACGQLRRATIDRSPGAIQNTAES